MVEGRAHQAAGGAAFISALAAHSAGARVGLVALVPPTLPPQIAQVFGPGGLDRSGLHPWPGSLPRFAIAYDPEQEAHYTEVSAGMESELRAAHIPKPWLAAPWVHIAAIGGDADQQLQLARDVRARGYSGQLSAGTFGRMVREQTDSVRSLLALSDLFFMNAEELGLLLPEGPPESHAGTLVVTHGSEGVEVIGGPGAGRYPAHSTRVVDTTGAGDALCGGYLAGIVTGADPVQVGLAQAATVIDGIGATPLLVPASRQVGPRAAVAPSRVAAVAATLSTCATGSAIDFSDPPHLAAGHPEALSMLWLSTLHQYGFWTATHERWTGPMYADLDGIRYKGSDFIWAAFARAARADPSQLQAERMSREPDLFARICTDDTGACPVPDLQSHSALHMAHGHAMVGQSYDQILDEVRRSTTPGAALLELLRRQPGYMGDPLQKKASLLLLILSARPERFLTLESPNPIPPIVDYHLMRGCLRTGCVTISDPDLERRLQARAWIDAPEELAVRQACGRAIAQLVEQSGTTVAAVDGFFFVNGRKLCLESEPARCESCLLQESCAQETALFQPVFRTTAY
jgi:ribokinase